MSLEDLEALLLRTRGPEPSGAVERRVQDALRRPRTPSRAFALAAVALFALVLAVVLGSERQDTPGGSGRVRHWGQILREGNQVVATLSAEDAVLVDGVATLRNFSAKLLPSKGPAVTIRAESGRFDLKESRIVVEGVARIAREDGFTAEASGATVDLRRKSWSATLDLAARYATRTGQKADTWKPKVSIEAKSAKAWDEGATYELPVVTLSCGAWTFSVAGREIESTSGLYRILTPIRAMFEDGQALEPTEAILSVKDRSFRLTATFP